MSDSNVEYYETVSGKLSVLLSKVERIETKLDQQIAFAERQMKRKGKAHRSDVDADKTAVVKEFMGKHCEMREGAGTPLEALFKRFCEHYPGESISKVTLSRILVQSGCRRVAQGRYKQSVFLGVHMDP